MQETFRLMIKVKSSFTIGLTLLCKENHKHQRTPRKCSLTLYSNNQKHPIFSFLAFCLCSSYLLWQHKHIHPTLNLILRSVHVACNGLYQPKIVESGNQNCFSLCILLKENMEQLKNVLFVLLFITTDLGLEEVQKGKAICLVIDAK